MGVFGGAFEGERKVVVPGKDDFHDRACRNGKGQMAERKSQMKSVQLRRILPIFY
ncbi:MAG: hypothetical protein O6826_04380 [Acidobacteria bacterium]|nr:hypothetical protein [Acidobacteriota bacterium]MCZ6878835.1 hypothetical protein [Acidobacteriota bacterium]